MNTLFIEIYFYLKSISPFSEELQWRKAHLADENKASELQGFDSN